jgi:hypothetical protein
MLYLQNVGLALILFALAAVGIYHILNRIVWLLTPRREWSYRDTDPRRPDSAEQLRWVMAGNFERKRVMSKPEYRVFKEIEAEATACKGGYRVFAQTSLGEVLRSTDKRAHSAINSKRSDILVIGPDGFPVLAVEHQGEGHYQFDAAARDAVKREALRKAGVACIEVFDADSSEDIRSKVRSVLDRRAAAA